MATVEVGREKIDACTLSVLVTRLQCCGGDGVKRVKAVACGFGDAAAAELARVISRHPCLLHLDLSDNCLSAAGLSELLRGLGQNKVLRTLRVDNTPLAATDESRSAVMASFNDFIQSNNTLHEISLRGSGLPEADERVISRALELNYYPLQVKRAIRSFESGTPASEIDVEYVAIDPKACTQAAVDRLADAIRVCAGGSSRSGGDVRKIRVKRAFKGLDLRRFCGAIALLPRLRSVDLIDVGVQDVEVDDSLAVLVATSPSLEVLDVSSNDLAAEGVSALARAAGQSATVVKVVVSGSKVPPPVLARLEAACSLNAYPCTLRRVLPSILANDPRVTRLLLAGTNGSDRGPNGRLIDNMAASIISESLQQNTSVTELQLQDNHIGPEGCSALGDVIKTCRSVTAIDLSGNTVGDDGGRRLIQALAGSDSLTRLDLGGCGVSPPLLAEVAEMTRVNTFPIRLKRLLPHLSSGSLADSHIDTVIFNPDALEAGEDDGRLLGPEGTAALCAALQRNRTVTRLDLSNSGVGDDGAAAVARLLAAARAPKLQRIKLCGNGIGATGAGLLLRSAHHARSVTQLDLAGNRGVPDDLREEIDFAVSLNTLDPTVTETLRRLLNGDAALTTVDFSGRTKKLTDENMKVVADAFVGNAQITEVDLSNNLFGDRGAAHLCTWLRGSSTEVSFLSRLSLARNGMGPAAARALAAALEEPAAPRLRALDVSGNSVKDAGALALLRYATSSTAVVVELAIHGNGQCDELSSRIYHACAVNRYWGAPGGPAAAAAAAQLQAVLAAADASHPADDDGSGSDAASWASGRSGVSAARRAKKDGKRRKKAGGPAKGTGRDRQPAATDIDASGSPPGAVPTVAFCVARSATVRSVTLRSCSIAAADVACLAAAVRGHPSLVTLDLRGNPGLTDAGIRALAAEIEAAPPKQLRSVLVDDSRSQQQEESSEALHLPRETRGNGAVRAPASEFEAAAECENKAESPHPQGNPLREATSNPNSSQPAQGVPADDGSPSAAERLRSAVLLARLPEAAARVVLQVRGNSPGVVSVNCDVLLCQGGGGGEPLLGVGQTRPRSRLGGAAGAGGEAGGIISIDVPAAEVEPVAAAAATQVTPPHAHGVGARSDAQKQQRRQEQQQHQHHHHHHDQEQQGQLSQQQQQQQHQHDQKQQEQQSLQQQQHEQEQQQQQQQQQQLQQLQQQQDQQHAQEQQQQQQQQPPTNEDESPGDLLATVLRTALQQNDTVRHVSFTGTSLTDAGARDVATAIKASNVDSFDVSNNPITAAGFEELVKAVWQSDTVTALNVQGIQAFQRVLTASGTPAAEDETEVDAFLLVLLDKLNARLERNAKNRPAALLSKEHAAERGRITGGSRRRRPVHVELQMAQYRTSSFLLRQQHDIMADALHGYVRKPDAALRAY
ncbi:hypothetical protein DIPPA_17270 [Diplonema papillatum]|nr:hypothetical protein DIPPA_17270 [Diplonema papillatum]